MCVQFERATTKKESVVSEMDDKPGGLVSVRTPYIAFPDVVRVFVYVSGQAKVTDLHDVVL